MIYVLLQKLTALNLEHLQVPPFESELKRTSQNAKAATAKMAISVPEAGTSVAPRQRPKGSAQPSHNLPLVAPPSPSPRNTLSSPIPPPTDTTPQPIAEPFPTQFQANFPPVTVAATPIVAAVPAALPTTTALPLTTQISNATTITNDTADRIDSLFQSKFPDPFRESTTSIGSNSVGSGSGGVGSSGGLFSQEDATIAQLQQQDVVMPLEVVGTPTKNIQLLVAPKVGHRRNMSDTTAFNKYIHFGYIFKF